MKSLMTTKELTNYLNVPKSSVDYWVRKGELAYYGFGKQRHFDKSEIDKWMRLKRRINGKGKPTQA